MRRILYYGITEKLVSDSIAGWQRQTRCFFGGCFYAKVGGVSKNAGAYNCYRGTNEKAAGFAKWYGDSWGICRSTCFVYLLLSKFIGEKGLYIDAFYVEEGYRSKGVGKKMLTHMAYLALRSGCGRLEWGCLDWNTPAIQFYENLGAKGVDIMTIYRMNKEGLCKML